MNTACENDEFITLIVSLKGHEQVRSRVRKDVIQSESSFLKEYIEDGASEINIPLKHPKNLNLILMYLNKGKLGVRKENHLASLWNDATILGLENLQKFCVQRLTDRISLRSWIQILEFSQAEGCHELESNVLSFVNDNFENCCSSWHFKSLTVDQMVQVLQLPAVKATVTESNRIALILDWIKTNEVKRCSQAHRLLEQVDLIKLTESSLRSYFDGESALRSWRCVAIFERAIQLKRVEEAERHSYLVQEQLDESELMEAGPNVFESIDNRLIINIKQEVASEESSSEESSSDEVNESIERMNPEDSLRESRTWVKQEVSQPLPLSVCGTLVGDNDPPPPKIPKLEHTQNEVESFIPSQQTEFVSKKKQILYFSQRSDDSTSLNFVVISADSISKPQRVLAELPLPQYIHGVPKLIWDKEAKKLSFLGNLCHDFHRKFPSFNYINGQAAPITALPRMFQPRQHHQPVVLNGRLYVFGGSRFVIGESESVIFKNKNRLSGAEVLDMTTAIRSEWQWQNIRCTGIKRDRYAAACVEGNIYQTGGAIDNPASVNPVITNNAACYVPGKNRWKKVRKMKNRRCDHAMAVLGYKIYVFGGRGSIDGASSEDLDNMKSSEVYDVHDDMWTLIAPMLRPRYGGSAIEMEGKIYVIGGDQSNEGDSPSSVECYDPMSNSWTLVSEFVDHQGLFDSITVIDDPEYFLTSS